MADQRPAGTPAEITAAISEISAKAQLLVREEIELAKVEVTEKVTKLAKGAAIGAAAAVFVLAGLLMLLHGLAWLAYFALPIGNEFSYFWGFFFIALLLFILGAVAGLLAKKAFEKFAPPKPDMAIAEAQLIKETVSR